ncbi:MAG: MarR family transcriptional regulator [Promethearchaeota archaeon]|nr:MAG: MarR family transcriptional regulator [Candidatus Lokiarchaeota archaeon]
MEKLREGGFLITKIHQLSQRIFSKLLEEYEIHEITAAQGRILFPLWKQNNLSFQDLKKKTLLSKSTLSYFLDQLEAAGFIERIHSEDDKRTISIKLIAINEKVKRKFIDVSKKMKKIYYKEFSEQQIDDFESYLRHILQNLMDYNNKKK